MRNSLLRINNYRLSLPGFRVRIYSAWPIKGPPSHKTNIKMIPASKDPCVSNRIKLILLQKNTISSRLLTLLMDKAQPKKTSWFKLRNCIKTQTTVSETSLSNSVGASFIHTHTHTQTHTHIYTYTHTHTHTYIYICKS